MQSLPINVSNDVVDDDELTSEDDVPAVNGNQYPFNRPYRIAWIQGKRDPEQEAELIAWLSEITGEESVTENDLALCLKDGVMLSRLSEIICPELTRRSSNTSKIRNTQFAQMETISNFLKAAEQFGLRKEEMFQLTDLTEAANIPKVTACLLHLKNLLVAEPCY